MGLGNVRNGNGNGSVPAICQFSAWYLACRTDSAARFSAQTSDSVRVWCVQNNRRYSPRGRQKPAPDAGRSQRPSNFPARFGQPVQNTTWWSAAFGWIRR